ncbi:zinc-dependent metalloprotease [Streptomyces sp. NPDC013161]|uniref:zinc-dependent metalloprotease n=1 Tax=Streptomyces sp. NPDC013161 TaxID=3364862 RepID=UPI00368D7672
MYVQHETRHAELADRVEELARVVLPWVEKVTGLPLPRPRFELVDVDGLATAYRSFVRRQMERDTEGLDLTCYEQAKLVVHPQAAEALVRHAGLSERPVLIATSVGQPSTLIVPESLGLQKLSETPDLLCDLLVHSLTQQAQVIAGGGQVVPAPEWPKFSTSKHPIVQLSEGHAQWTSSLVTREITGSSRPDRSPLANVLARSLLERVADRRVARASALVDQAVSTRGLPAFNAVWNTPSLVPTLAEFRHPGRWIGRMPPP